MTLDVIRFEAWLNIGRDVHKYEWATVARGPLETLDRHVTTGSGLPRDDLSSDTSNAPNDNSKTIGFPPYQQ